MIPRISSFLGLRDHLRDFKIEGQNMVLGQGPSFSPYLWERSVSSGRTIYDKALRADFRHRVWMGRVRIKRSQGEALGRDHSCQNASVHICGLWFKILRS